MKVKLFSILAEEIGSTIDLSLNDGFYAKDVKDSIKKAYPDFSDILDQSLVAINEEYANDEAFKLADVTEIAIIPPVSGG
ncbi:MoaD/ThiS family protein [Companilactobacillus baiquanensis]|uniref:Molybdopterin synthase sulfur carrier subunit n=1 Tax=Companilactobacillus baiquanensis TaxID=2486005 RepID=A0ABW1USE3_9LACO|nr:MoaD/ThiS family protein [Companilactobacillus baiquanensis]